MKLHSIMSPDEQDAFNAHLNHRDKLSLQQHGWAAQTWWPECPWPEDMWSNTLAQITPKYMELVADEHIRTCISGVLMRHGWRLAEKEIMERLTEAGIVPPNESSSPTAADGNGGAERKR